MDYHDAYEEITHREDMMSLSEAEARADQDWKSGDVSNPYEPGTLEHFGYQSRIEYWEAIERESV